MATRSTANPEGVASSSLRVLSHQVDDCVRRAYCSVSEKEDMDRVVGVLLLLEEVFKRFINLSASHICFEVL